jgi:3-isopropylmalate/(R)-2-methylmalate dehydratase small subunit
VECDTSSIEEGERIMLEFGEGKLVNLSKGVCIPIKKPPPFLLGIIEEGGLLEYVKRRGLRL